MASVWLGVQVNVVESMSCCQALDDGTVGMKKNGRRFVIAPSSMAYGQDGKQGKVSADAVVAFEIDVVRVCRKILVLGSCYLSLPNKAGFNVCPPIRPQKVFLSCA